MMLAKPAALSLKDVADFIFAMPSLNSESDPSADPINHETCRICGGSGIRDDAIGAAHRKQNPEYTCNGCSQGPRPGTSTKWPSSWARHDGDVRPVSQVLEHIADLQKPHAIVTPTAWIERETWDGKEFVELADLGGASPDFRTAAPMAPACMRSLTVLLAHPQPPTVAPLGALTTAEPRT